MYEPDKINFDLHNIKENYNDYKVTRSIELNVTPYLINLRKLT